MSRTEQLMDIYRAMEEHFGPSGWWPAAHPFEVAVGAVLTQNTAWTNVEKALALLREAGALSPASLWNLPANALERCLRPSGFFRQKALRLRNLLAFFAAEAGEDAPPDDTSLSFLRSRDTDALRAGLLGVRGIGPETADAILLYALERPAFVVDAYTRRIFHRHGHCAEDAGYEELRDYFMDVLDADAALFNEYHALIVRTAKDYCKKTRPRCSLCPLGPLLDHEVD